MEYEASSGTIRLSPGEMDLSAYAAHMAGDLDFADGMSTLAQQSKESSLNGIYFGPPEVEEIVNYLDKLIQKPAIHEFHRAQARGMLRSYERVLTLRRLNHLGQQVLRGSGLPHPKARP